MRPKIFAAGIALLLSAASLVFAAIPPAEALLPADTLLVFSVPDFSALRQAIQRSPQWLLWEDPAMKPFRDDFTAKWNQKFVGPLEQSLGVRMADYLPLLQGQLTFAITQNGWGQTAGTAPAMVLLLDAGNKSDLMATNIALLKKKWTDSGKTLRTVQIEDVNFSVLVLSSNSPAPFASVFFPAGTASAPAIYIGQFKSLLILGTSEKAVDSVAAHLHGGANPSLSQNARFAAAQLAQFYNTPLYYGWFNAKAFFEGVSTPQDSFQMSLRQLLFVSGLNGLKSVSFTGRESPGGAELEFYAAAPESMRQGLLKMFAAAPKEADPPPFVPATVTKFWRWRVDGQKSWNELEKTVDAFSPGVLDRVIQVANMRGRQENPDFDLRKNLIANLGDDWMCYSRAPTGSALTGLNKEPWLFLFSANNADQAALAIKTLASTMSDDQGKTRDFLGRKIYTLSIPSRHGGPAGSLYCAASGGYVALTPDATMIENYLRSDDGKTKPLSRRPGLIEAAQQVGGMGTGLFGYQNQRESARALFSALKNDPAYGAALNPLAGLPFSSAGNGIRSLMDFSLLPDYDAISKYFNFTVFAGATSSEGFDFKVFQPRSPELAQ